MRRLLSAAALVSASYLLALSAFSQTATATFEKYEEEGSEVCSITFSDGASRSVEVTDNWTGYGPEVAAYAYLEDAPWMKLVDVTNSRLEMAFVFADGFRLVSAAIVDDYSGRPYMALPPSSLDRLLTAPPWTLSVNGTEVVMFHGPPAPDLMKEFLRCVNEWKLEQAP